jgi:hypothetical protein
MCVDMTQPRNEMDGAGSRSPNATANTSDHTKHRNLKLTTALDFFQRVAVARVLGRTQRIGRMDYSRFYRQLLLALREWWFHLIGVGGVFRLDFAVPFGEKIGPHGCHIAMDSLLDMIGDKFLRYTDKMTNWDDAHWDASQFDKVSVLTALEAMDNHPDRRRLALMMAYTPYPSRSRYVRTAVLFPHACFVRACVYTVIHRNCTHAVIVYTQFTVANNFKITWS